jgi:hypothetical protein
MISIQNFVFEKIMYKLQFRTILLPYQKFVTEMIIYVRVKPSKSLSSNGFVVNTL